MGMGLHDFAAIGGLSGLGAAGIGSFSALASNMNNMNMNNLPDMHQLGAAQVGRVSAVLAAPAPLSLAARRFTSSRRRGHVPGRLWAQESVATAEG